MIELLLFIKNNKFQSLWIIISSLLINLLALSSALYVIQVFNRYLNYQINSTLTALTLGVLMAFSIELVLRIIRSFLVNKVTIINFRKEALKKISILTFLKINTNRTKSLLDEINPLNHVDTNKAEILIDEFIQNQPKIKPRTEFYYPENMARKSIEDSEKIVTETLAKIYSEQGNITKAKSIYNQLILKNHSII